MADDQNPLDLLFIQNMALRNILQQVIAQVAEESGDRSRWLRDLKARIALTEHAKLTAAGQSPEAQKLSKDVAGQVAKVLGLLKP